MARKAGRGREGHERWEPIFIDGKIMRRSSPGTLALVFLGTVVLTVGAVPAWAQPLAGVNSCGGLVNTAPSTVEPRPFTPSNPVSDAVRCLINAERTSRGLPALSLNTSLALAANGHAQEGARLKWWVRGADSHVHPETGPRTRNEAIAERIRLAGYCPAGATHTSENTYTGTGNDPSRVGCPLGACSTPAAAVNWWMNVSTFGHREAILDTRSREVGVGFAREGADRTVPPQREMGTYVVNFGACPTMPPSPAGPGGTSGTVRSIAVRFTKMHVNDCPEAGICDWKLTCGLGNQPPTELLTMVEVNTGRHAKLDRVLTQQGGLPVTVTCTVKEHDGGINPMWEHVGTRSMTIQTAGEQALRINQRSDEGDVTVHFLVEPQASITQPLTPAPTTQTWVARHNLSSSDYQQEFDRLGRQGFRLVQVSGYGIGGSERYAAIWERKGGPEYVARHGLTAAAYQAEFDRLGRQGFRLVQVSGYSVGGSERYAAIWERKGGPEYVARHGLTAPAYQAEFDRLGRQGFRLVQVSGYGVGGGERYAAIWERKGGPEYVARHGLTAAAYQAEFDRLGKQGFRLVQISGYGVGDSDRYAAIWERKGGPAFVARHGLTGAAYQAEFDRLARQGFRLVQITGYSVNGSDRYAAIWEK